MKFDSQSPYHHTYPAHEHDTKVIVHHNNPFILEKDDHFMIQTLSLDKEGLKEGKHSFTSPLERKSSRVAEEWEQYLDMEYSTNINKTGDEMVLKENFYTDKIVTNVEVPEKRDCIEDDHHIVKDITINKGAQSSDKSLAEVEVKEKEVACLMQSSTSNLILDTGHTDSTSKMSGSSGAYDKKYTAFESLTSFLDQDQVDSTFVLHNDLVDKLDENQTTENPADEVSSFLDSDGKHLIGCQGNIDSIESVVSDVPAEIIESSAVQVPHGHNCCDEKSFTVSSIDCGGKLDTSKSAVHNISSDVIEDQVLPSQEITTDSLKVDLSSQVLSNDQKQSPDGQTLLDPLKDSNSATIALSFSSEVSALSSESKKIPSSGVVTFNFDTEATSPSGRNENEETTNSHQAEVVQNGFHTEEGILDAPSSSSRYSFLRLMEGESILSGPSILSSPIANSGHIPYSGNISLRSESSTTSVRSFAFPILQSEWNSSPVKMAKADRRKHRGWKLGLLCCRF